MKNQFQRRVEELSRDVSTALYPIVHSAAVTTRRLENVVRMEIYDDGNGFEVNKPIRSQSSQRLGLLGMRERVEMIGGQFQVESKPGQETRIQVDIPRSHADHSPPPSGKIQSIPLK
jgi:signal transduction histidine kinase